MKIDRRHLVIQLATEPDAEDALCLLLAVGLLWIFALDLRFKSLKVKTTLLKVLTVKIRASFLSHIDLLWTCVVNVHFQVRCKLKVFKRA